MLMPHLEPGYLAACDLRPVLTQFCPASVDRDGRNRLYFKALQPQKEARFWFRIPVNADNQPTRSSKPQRRPEKRESARLEAESPEAWSLHSRLHDDSQKAELSS